MDAQGTGNSVSAVVRVFGILEELAKEPELQLGDLASRLYMSKSTIFRFLQTMKELGYVTQDSATGSYALTVKLFETGSHALNLKELTRAANTPMLELSELIGETIHLAILDKQAKSMLYVHKVDTDYSQSMFSRIGKKAPLHCTGIGKLLLAYSSDKVFSELMEGYDFRLFTAATHASEDSLRQEIMRIRELGYSEDNGEHEESIHCIAVPVWDRFGEIAAGLSISWPVFRYKEQMKSDYLEKLFSSAAVISSALGYYPEN